MSARPPSSSSSEPAQPDSASSHRSDVLFDIRTVIGGLFAVYGVVCLVWGLVSFTAADRAKTGGVNVNLWTGIGMIVLAVVFVGWTLLRPLHPAEQSAEPSSGPSSQRPEVDR